jgi:tetratricopeptide (TPR) repeat protein
MLNALSDLNRAAQLNPRSVLPSFFQGIVYERNGDAARAEAAYQRALELAPSCYPAELGLVRLLSAQGRGDEENDRLSDLLVRYPDNLAVKKQLARNYVTVGDWSRSEGAIEEILQRNPRDGEFLLLRAYIAIEQGQYRQAQAPLDTFAAIDAGNREYLFLRARLQSEAYHNRDSALNYLRSIIRTRPNDTEALVYAAGLLMESPRAADQNEGRTMLTRLLNGQDSSAEVLSLAVKDAVRREAWEEGKVRLDKLLELRRENRDLLAAYQVERGLGNNAAALAHARELYSRDSGNDDIITAYITALIDTGRQGEAERIIEQRLAALGGGILRGRYYYLRSRLRNNEEAAMNDLRSSLFEDPRNLDALIAMFEIYHRRKDERRAVYYLKQALAQAPDNPYLKRFEAEYRSSLGTGY